MSTCPECAGSRLPDHPAGLLVISHKPTCSLGAAEDARKVADADAVALGYRSGLRDTTTTERVLLAAITGTDPGDVPDVVHMRSIAGGAVVERCWFAPDGSVLVPADP